MTNQPETLQDSINTDFLPYGMDMPYRIIVGNNPVNFVDPWGLVYILPPDSVSDALGDYRECREDSYTHCEKILEECKEECDEDGCSEDIGIPGCKSLCYFGYGMCKAFHGGRGVYCEVIHNPLLPLPVP